MNNSFWRKSPEVVQEITYYTWLHSNLDFEDAMCLREQVYFDYIKKGINDIEVQTDEMDNIDVCYDGDGYCLWQSSKAVSLYSSMYNRILSWIYCFKNGK